MAPWEKIKTDPDHAHSTVSILTYLVRNIAISISPYMPETSRNIMTMLNLEGNDWNTIGSFEGLDVHKIGKPRILHKKLDPKMAETFRKQFSGEQSDFGRLQLKVGEILQVEKHPNADQLYHLSVDVGEDKPRSIVAGLGKIYTHEELSGRKIIVVANLKPSKIRDIISEGMSLVCKKRNKMELLDGSPFKPGEMITVDDQKIDHKELTIDEFQKANLHVKNGLLMFDEQQCKIGDKPIETPTLKIGKVC